MVTKSYQDSYAQSLEEPDEFWLDAAGKISWSTPPQQALDSSRAPLYSWFPDGVLNTSYNALDRHVAAGRGGQDALIYDSAMLGTRRRYSYAELTELVARFAGVLRSQRRGQGGPGGDLHADDSRSRHRHAGNGAAGCGPFGGLRRFRAQGAGRPHPGRRARRGGHGVRRHRAFAPDRIPARGRGSPPPGRRPRAPRDCHGTGRLRLRSFGLPRLAGLGNGDGRRRTGGAGRRQSHGPALHPLHLRNHRHPQGSGAGQRRPCRGAQLDHGKHLRHRPRGRHVDRLRRRLGGGALLHRLRPAAGRRHHRPVRGQTGGHA